MDTIKGFLEKKMNDNKMMKNIRNDFAKNGYFCFKDFSFLPKPILENIFKEVTSLVNEFGTNTDVNISTTENTKRKFIQVNQPSIKKHGTLINEVYNNKAIKDFLGYIANDELVSSWEYEQTLITKMTESEDTHGWHWGDYPYTLIWIVEHPTDPKDGALLQCVPHTYWDKNSNDMTDYLLNNKISTFHHLKGDVYFLKSDTTLHHVSPLNKSSLRIMLNTCWGSILDTREEVGHETIEEIWGVK